MRKEDKKATSMLEIKASDVTKGGIGANDEGFGGPGADVPTSRFVYGGSLSFADTGGGSGGGGGS